MLMQMHRFQRGPTSAPTRRAKSARRKDITISTTLSRRARAATRATRRYGKARATRCAFRPPTRARSGSRRLYAALLRAGGQAHGALRAHRQFAVLVGRGLRDLCVVRTIFRENPRDLAVDIERIADRVVAAYLDR